MGKEKDKQTKTAPPRTSDASRFANFLGQTGLKAEGSAKQRRFKESSRTKGGKR